MKRCEHDFAFGNEITHALFLSLSILLAQLLQISVDGPPLLPGAGFSNRRLLGVHFGPDVLDDGPRLAGASQDVERVVQDGGQQTGGVAEADQGDFVRGEALNDVVYRDIGGAADEDAGVGVEGEELED